MKRFILKTFGYPEGFLKELDIKQLDKLYNRTLEYVWTKLFMSEPQDKVERIRKLIDEAKYKKVLKLYPNFLQHLKKYGKTFFAKEE